jgi:putative transposase
MSHYRRANTKGATYFFTVVTYQRRNFLCDDDVRTALRDAIIKVRERHPFQIDAWVLLPDHLHAIWTLPPDDANFTLRWQQIKRHVTQQCGHRLHENALMNESKHKHRESTLWQRRYWEHQIRDETDYQHHMDYVHYNPVKHGFVARAIDWPHSSFQRYYAGGVYSENWAAADKTDDLGFGE